MKKSGPCTIQQVIHSIPHPSEYRRHQLVHQDSSDSTKSNSSLGGYLTRDQSFQSEDASQCSSVESVLDMRRPDPETVLLELGFGPPRSSDFLAKIPKRFLQPSRMLGININNFLHDYAELEERLERIRTMSTNETSSQHQQKTSTYA